MRITPSTHYCDHLYNSTYYFVEQLGILLIATFSTTLFLIVMFQFGQFPIVDDDDDDWLFRPSDSSAIVSQSSFDQLYKFE
jgi:hypothetical protein